MFDEKEMSFLFYDNLNAHITAVFTWSYTPSLSQQSKRTAHAMATSSAAIINFLVHGCCYFM